jgi:hypothetical protein
MTSFVCSESFWLDGKLAVGDTVKLPFGSLAACVCEPQAATTTLASPTSAQQVHDFLPLTRANFISPRAPPRRLPLAFGAMVP